MKQRSIRTEWNDEIEISLNENRKYAFVGDLKINMVAIHQLIQYPKKEMHYTFLVF